MKRLGNFYYKKFRTKKLFEFLVCLEKKYCYNWLTGKTKDKRLVDMCSIIKQIDEYNSPDEIFDSKELGFNWNEFESAIVDQDFYKKSYAKYVLVKLEYLSSENTTGRKFGATSIEHVLPQTINDNSQWLKTFSQEEREKWINNVANLILLSKRKNSSASNLNFADKKEKYFKGKITDLPRSLLILTIPDWTPSILSERQKQIVEMLK